jgi:hypothetical protein
MTKRTVLPEKRSPFQDEISRVRLRGDKGRILRAFASSLFVLWWILCCGYDEAEDRSEQGEPM